MMGKSCRLKDLKMNTVDLCSTVLEIESEREREKSSYEFTLAQVTEQSVL